MRPSLRHRFAQDDNSILDIVEERDLMCYPHVLSPETVEIGRDFPDQEEIEKRRNGGENYG